MTAFRPIPLLLLSTLRTVPKCSSGAAAGTGAEAGSTDDYQPHPHIGGRVACSAPPPRAERSEPRNSPRGRGHRKPWEWTFPPEPGRVGDPLPFEIEYRKGKEIPSSIRTSPKSRLPAYQTRTCSRKPSPLSPERCPSRPRIDMVGLPSHTLTPWPAAQGPHQRTCPTAECRTPGAGAGAGPQGLGGITTPQSATTKAAPIPRRATDFRNTTEPTSNRSRVRRLCTAVSS